MGENLKRLKELQESLFEKGFESMNIIDELPICIHEIDLEGKITKMNKAGLSMLGYTKNKEVAGQDYFSFVHNDHINDVKNHWDIAHSGETSKFLYKTTGEKYYSSCFTPIITEGKLEKIVGFTQDITDYLDSVR
jgi:PAS domain S-box-containing protein